MPATRRQLLTATALLAGCNREPGDPLAPPRLTAPTVPLEHTWTLAHRLASQLPRLRSLLIHTAGELRFERYYHGARRYRAANIKSASKSVIAALTGIAIHRGHIPSVHTPIGEFFTGLPQDKAAITVEDLVTMRSGLASTSGRNYGHWVAQRNWVRYALNQPLEADPGSRVIYSTGNTHLLSAILTKATGQTTYQFAQRHLAQPLGFTLATWPRDPQGIYFGGNNMNLTPRQMLRFGLLYLNRGESGGKQILPQDWIESTYIPRGRSRYSGRQYGYGWWLRELDAKRSAFAWGYGGQFIFVVPERDLVAVTTSDPTPGETRRGHLRAVYSMVEDVLASLEA